MIDISNGMKRLEAQVYGDVHGVSFRAFAAREARSRAITGTVSNTAEGSVLVIAEGETHELESFLLQLKAGPRFGRVDRVETCWTEVTGTFSDFRVL